jgi:hypothetical protein
VIQTQHHSHPLARLAVALRATPGCTTLDVVADVIVGCTARRTRSLARTRAHTMTAAHLWCSSWLVGTRCKLARCDSITGRHCAHTLPIISNAHTKHMPGVNCVDMAAAMASAAARAAASAAAVASSSTAAVVDAGGVVFMHEMCANNECTATYHQQLFLSTEYSWRSRTINALHSSPVLPMLQCYRLSTTKQNDCEKGANTSRTNPSRYSAFAFNCSSRSS